jgi:glycosyltransferase involved in cell wall biosynthesis
VVHVNSFEHASLAWKTPLLLAAHTCMHSWWRAVHGTPAPASWRDYGQAVASALRMADLVVAPTSATLRDLQQQHGPLPAARVIPHGRCGADAPAQAKGEYVFSTAHPGDRGQNLAALGDAAARLSWPLRISTPDGESHDPLADMAGDGKMSGRASAARWLARAPIFALPALHAPAGLAIHEAALARCALVLGDVDGLREIWDGAAIFVDPNDGSALAHALQGLIADKGIRQRYAQLAFDRARRFTPSAMAAAYAAAYAEIAAPECAGVARAPMRC